MAPIIPNPKKIKSFRTGAAFESWMRRNHAREAELWLRVYKKGLRRRHDYHRTGARRGAVLGLD